MKLQSKQYFLVLLLLSGLLSSCIGLNIKPGEKIYWDNEVIVENNLPKKERKKLEKRLKSEINPSPVRHTLGMKWKIKNFKPDSSYVPKDSIKFGFLRQEPLVYESSFLSRGDLILKNYLDRFGYFNSEIESDTLMEGDLKVKQTFCVHIDSPFKVARINYSCPNEEITKLIRDSFPSPYIKVGGDMAPTFSDLEKDRIRKLLTSKGYFKAQYMRIRVAVDTIAQADLDTFGVLDTSSYADTISTNFDKVALIDISFNHEANSDTLIKYYLDSIFINISNFSSKKLSNIETDTFERIVLTKPHESLPTQIVLNSIYESPGELWSQSSLKNSQRKLNQYNYFQTTENNTVDRQVPGTNQINRYYNLKMNKSKSLGGNINFYRSSLGGGIQINPTFFNRNVKNKAVKFEFSPSYSMDITVPSDSTKFNLNNRDNMIIDQALGFNTSLATPKLIPNVKINPKKDYISESSLDLSIVNNRRTGAFVFNNYVTSIKYLYKPIKNIVYEVQPLFTNITDYRYRSPEFQAEISNNFFLRQTFASAFILGEFVGFSTNNGKRSGSRLKTYLSSSVEEAGALLQILEALKLFNTGDEKRTFAKYIKVDVNASALYQRPKGEFATRLLMGSGFLRGGNRTMPYVKQYVIGGPYELRGFPIRSVGPGHYFSDTTNSSSKIYQSADIKLVYNNEYRFNIKSISSIDIEGALFLDMGNIWTEKYDESRPGSEFVFKNIYNDLAISGGYGIRVNIAGLLLLRFDVGTKLKHPDATLQNGGWFLNAGQSFYDYYKSNTLAQFAVGYPF